MGLTWLKFNGRSRPVAICILFQLSYLIHLLRLLRLLQFMHVFCVVLLQSGMDITHTNRKRAPNWNTSKTCQFFPLVASPSLPRRRVFVVGGFNFFTSKGNKRRGRGKNESSTMHPSTCLSSTTSSMNPERKKSSKIVLS